VGTIELVNSRGWVVGTGSTRKKSIAEARRGFVIRAIPKAVFRWRVGRPIQPTYPGLSDNASPVFYYRIRGQFESPPAENANVIVLVAFSVFGMFRGAVGFVPVVSIVAWQSLI